MTWLVAAVAVVGGSGTQRGVLSCGQEPVPSATSVETLLGMSGRLLTARGESLCRERGGKGIGPVGILPASPQRHHPHPKMHLMLQGLDTLCNKKAVLAGENVLNQVLFGFVLPNPAMKALLHLNWQCHSHSPCSVTRVPPSL